MLRLCHPGVSRYESAQLTGAGLLRRYGRYGHSLEVLMVDGCPTTAILFGGATKAAADPATTQHFQVYVCIWLAFDAASQPTRPFSPGDAVNRLLDITEIPVACLQHAPPPPPKKKKRKKLVLIFSPRVATHVTVFEFPPCTRCGPLQVPVLGDVGIRAAGRPACCDMDAAWARCQVLDGAPGPHRPRRPALACDSWAACCCWHWPRRR